MLRLPCIRYQYTIVGRAWAQVPNDVLNLLDTQLEHPDRRES
jgi:hypothetical protein